MKEIDPKVFGPGTWTVSHILAIVCDENDDHEFYCKLMDRLIHGLPCSKCRRHAVKYLSKNPIDGGSSSLFVWSVDFHNAVNKRLGKPIMPYAQAKELYENTELIIKNKEASTTCKITVVTAGDAETCQDAPL